MYLRLAKRERSVSATRYRESFWVAAGEFLPQPRLNNFLREEEEDEDIR